MLGWGDGKNKSKGLDAKFAKFKSEVSRSKAKVWLWVGGSG